MPLDPRTEAIATGFYAELEKIAYSQRVRRLTGLARSLRGEVPPLANDRPVGEDIEAVARLIENGAISAAME